MFEFRLRLHKRKRFDNEDRAAKMGEGGEKVVRKKTIFRLRSHQVQILFRPLGLCLRGGRVYTAPLIIRMAAGVAADGIVTFSSCQLKSF